MLSLTTWATSPCEDEAESPKLPLVLTLLRYEITEAGWDDIPVKLCVTQQVLHGSLSFLKGFSLICQDWCTVGSKCRCSFSMFLVPVEHLTLLSESGETCSKINKKNHPKWCILLFGRCYPISVDCELSMSHLRCSLSWSLVHFQCHLMAFVSAHQELLSLLY